MEKVPKEILNLFLTTFEDSFIVKERNDHDNDLSLIWTNDLNGRLKERHEKRLIQAKERIEMEKARLLDEVSKVEEILEQDEESMT